MKSMLYNMFSLLKSMLYNMFLSLNEITQESCIVKNAIKLDVL